MMTFLPPISSEQMALRSAHEEATMRPVSVEPVKEIKRRLGWFVMAAPAVSP
jgi:hypothetical protein